MPTYAQLAAEAVWNREIVTVEIRWLGAELCRRTRRPSAAFGVKGDDNHLRGAHRSQEWILKSRYATSRTYTVQAGLTAVQQRHLAGVDFTPGSAAEMIAQCKRIYAAMRGGRLDEVREFYGNVDGDKIVDGWDNVRNRAASSDSSHLWHWHLTLDRRHCTNKNLMERILAIALGDTAELEDGVSADDVVKGLEIPVEWQSDGVEALAKRKGMSKKDIRSLIEMSWESAVLSRDLLLEIRANQATMLGKDFVNEREIVDGVLTGLGSQDLQTAAAALRAAFGDRAAELAELLAAAQEG